MLRFEFAQMAPKSISACLQRIVCGHALLPVIEVAAKDLIDSWLLGRFRCAAASYELGEESLCAPAVFRPR
jgi:hypothetical protein